MKIRKYKLKFMIILTLFLGIYTVFSEDYKDTEASFEPLGRNETFHLKYKNGNLVLAASKDSVLLHRDNIWWGDWQISKDRRKVLFFEEDGDQVNIFLIDGNKGKCSFIMRNFRNAMSDVSMKYILCQNTASDFLNLSLYEIETGKATSVKMNIDNPNIFREECYTLSIYRSEDEKYDFIVKVEDCTMVVTEYGFNIASKTFHKIFDETAPSKPLYDYSEATIFEFPSL